MKRITAVLLALTLMLTMSVCGAAEGTKSDQQNTTEGQTDVRAEWPGLITVATSSSGGTTYYIGATQCQILENGLDGIVFSPEATDGGPNINGAIVQSDPSCMGIIAVFAAREALDGSFATMPGIVLDKLRIIMAGHSTTLQFVTLKESGITSMSDLGGKRIALPPPGTVAYVVAERCLERMGYTEKDFASFTAMSNTDMADALKDGAIDVGIFMGGRPMAAVSDLNSTRDIVILEIPEDILNSMVEEQPGYEVYTISGNEYSDLTEECNLLGWRMGMFCNADMDEDLVYEITRILNENTEEMAAAHADGAEWTTENTLNFYKADSTLFHPGAARYYDEIQGK